jgi:hypothetical protein
MKTRRIALRSLANGKIVCAENGGEQALIANRTEIGAWETFELIELDEGNGYPAPAPDLPFVPPQPAPAPSPPDVRPLSGSGWFALDRLVRVTTEADGEFINRGYSYWSQAVILGDAAYVFAGNADGEVYFFQVTANGHVARLGALLPYRGTGEGWYLDAEGWVYLLEGPRLRRVNPLSGENRVVFDISDEHPGCVLWQSHSSDSGQTHCATVKRIVNDGSYPAIGTVVFRNGRQEYFPAQGTLDESALAGDEWLIIKEDDDNRIINLQTRETRLIRDRERALGHSDCGPDFMVGEADKPDPGACVIWNLRDLNRGPRILFHTTNMGHVSVRNGICLLSDDTHLSLVSLAGGSVVSFLAHGMIGSGYNYQCIANLSPCGRVACYMSNQGSGRFDVFLTPIPA